MTQIAVSAGSNVSVSLAAGSKLLLTGQGTYRIGPLGTSQRPTVDELIDTMSTIGPFSDSCTVQMWGAGAGATYEVVLPTDSLDQTGRPVSGGGNLAPYTGPVSNSQHPQWANSTGATRAIDCGVMKQATEDIPDLTLGWTLQYSVQETGLLGDTATVYCEVEYPIGGTRTPMTRGGAFPFTIPGTGIVYGDSVKLATKIPRGAWYRIKVFVTYNGSNASYMRDFPQDYMEAGWYANSYYDGHPSIVNSVGSNTIPGTSNGTAYFEPCLILGKTTRHTMAVVGDSIVAADYSYSHILDSSGNTGIVTKLVSALGMAVVKLAANGDSYSSIIGPNTNNVITSSQQFARFQIRKEMGSYCSLICSELGANDAAITNAQFLTNMRLLFTQFPGKIYGHSTLLPQTTSTDNWMTTANQTIPANAANRRSYNTSIRNKAYPLSFYIEVSDVVSPLRDGKWAAPGPEARNATDIVTTANNSNISSASGAFRATDAGRSILIFGSKTAGAWSLHTISSVTDANNAVIGGGTAGRPTISNAGGTNATICPQTQDGLHPEAIVEGQVAASTIAGLDLRKFVL